VKSVLGLFGVTCILSRGTVSVVKFSIHFSFRTSCCYSVLVLYIYIYIYIYMLFMADIFPVQFMFLNFYCNLLTFPLYLIVYLKSHFLTFNKV
jgi:hypothetical protein